MRYLTTLLRTIKQESPFLYWVVVIHALFAISCLIGLSIDHRTLMGVNVWIKPLKFAISGGIYIATVGFLITLYPYGRLKKSIMRNTVAFTLLIEMGIIFMQGARGIKSHYNMTNQIDGFLFAAMGILVAINVLIMVLFIFDTIIKKMDTSKSMQWAILLGWLVVFFGSWIGGQMISQMAHNVGATDGGAGLPLVNWSTVAGDLRVAHFFGLHGIQLIPIFAFIISKKWRTIDHNQIILVTVFGLMYAAWIGFTFYQAKQGLPLISM